MSEGGCYWLDVDENKTSMCNAATDNVPSCV